MSTSHSGFKPFADDSILFTTCISRLRRNIIKDLRFTVPRTNIPTSDHEDGCERIMAALDRLSEITNWHEFIELQKKLSSRVFQGWNKLFSHQSGVSKDLRILQRLCQDSALHCFDLGSDINGLRADTLPSYHLDCIPVYLCYSEMLSEYWPESGSSLPCKPLSTQQNSLLETIGSHMDCILSIKDLLSPKERERLLVGRSVLQSVAIDKDFEGIFRSSRMIDGSISNATCLDGKLQEVLDARSKLQDAVQAVKEELYPLFPASQGVPPQ